MGIIRKKNINISKFRDDNKSLFAKWQKEFERMDYGQILKASERKNERYRAGWRLYSLACERTYIEFNDVSLWEL